MIFSRTEQPRSLFVIVLYILTGFFFIDAGNEEVPVVSEQTEPVVPAEVAPTQEKTATDQQVLVQEDQSNEETIENIENFLESEKKSGMPKEKWVTVVFDEQGKQIPDKSMGKVEKSVYDLVRHYFFRHSVFQWFYNLHRVEKNQLKFLL